MRLLLQCPSAQHSQQPRPSDDHPTPSLIFNKFSPSDIRATIMKFTMNHTQTLRHGFRVYKVLGINREPSLDATIQVQDSQYCRDGWVRRMDAWNVV